MYLHTTCDNDATWEVRAVVDVESSTLVKDLVPKSIVTGYP